MKSAIRRTQFKPVVEVLEDRYVPSGNVTAAIQLETSPSLPDGVPVIKITGDAEANDISVVFEGYPNVYLEGHNGTTVNGQETFSFDQGQQFFAVEVDMGAGDDAIIVAWQGAMSEGVSIDTGLGSDSVAVLLAAGIDLDTVSIQTGLGDDHVTIAGTDTVHRVFWLDVRTGNGDDRVDLQGEFEAPGGWGLWIDLGNGNDTLASSDGYFRGWKSISGGFGDDEVLNAAYFGFGTQFWSFEVVD